MEAEKKRIEEGKKMNRGIGILIIKEGKVLLGHRCEGWTSGTWTMPGGRLKEGERPEDGARREVEEETGLGTDGLEIIFINMDMIKDREFTTYILKPRMVLGEPMVKEPEEIDRWEWFELEKLPDPMYPPSQKAIEQYLMKLKGE